MRHERSILGMISSLGITAIHPSFNYTGDHLVHSKAVEFMQGTLPYIQYLGAATGALIGLLTLAGIIKRKLAGGKADA
jgi:hypothetical protein